MRSSQSTRSQNGHLEDFDDWGGGDWQEPAKPRRDWKKALLVLGLGALSWVATYVGMLELIQSNMGDLSFSHKVIIGCSVAMLMIMIIWLLDQMFATLPLITKLSYIAGYVFLTMISVGFGFGFYWKVLESRSEASRSAESAVTQVKTALFGASARLDQLQTTLDQLTQISAAKAIEERDRGTTCPNSSPGDGPRRRLRDADAARFGFASQFVKGRAAKSKTDMAALDVELKKIVNTDPSTFDPKTGTRNAFLQALTRRLELTATGFNAFRTDPQLRQIRTELAERASRTEFPNSRGGTFSCPDPQLQSALRGVVRAIDQLPELGKPQIATVEGAQAVVEAFRRLTATFHGILTFKLPPSADELRALQQKAVQSVENAAQRQAEIKANQGGLSKRDYIPLAIAIFVDLCLLLVSIGRPMNRLHGLIPKMREAERGPVYQILSRFDDIHRDQKIRERFEIFRHVVFDFNGDYYVAVPLDSPRNRNPDEVKALQQESHLLANLFASFEKEKIFSRVYNPLLTRKTIQKKLWRQGSKFAESQAFRTYRFRDGAWSEIILGAVMGASRDVSRLNRRRERDRGHSLDMPEPQSAPTPDEAAAVHRSLDEQLRHAADTAWPMETPAAVDPTLAEKYGPYARSVAGGAGPASGERPVAARWPYRKPEPGPGEAHVDVHVAANSNTSPDQGGIAPGNVIPMPAPRSPVEQGQAPEPLAQNVASPDRDYLAPAHGQLSEAVAWDDEHVAGDAEDEDRHTLTPDVILQPYQPNAAGGDERAGSEAAAETGINVRITERTADFTLPVTDAQIPQRILQTAQHVDAAQLTMDLEPEVARTNLLVPPPLPTQSDTVDAKDVPIEHPLISVSDQQDGDVGEHEAIELGDANDDPILRVAHRFAAKTGAPD